jgi:chromosome segregation ATPase
MMRTSNLKKVLALVEVYFNQVKECPFRFPVSISDVSALAVEGDQEGARRGCHSVAVALVELVLYLALTSEDSSRFVTHIMGMDEDVQHVLMERSQQAMALYGNSAGDLSMEASGGPGHGAGAGELGTPTGGGGAPAALREELASANAQLDYLSRSNKELERRVRELEFERSGLLSDKAELTAKLQSAGDPAEMERLVKEVQALTRSRQEDSSNDQTLRLALEEREKEVSLLKAKVIEVSSQAHETARLLDEIDILKSQVAQVPKLESQIERFKAKLDEAGDLRRAVKDLEAQNQKLIDAKLKAEEEARSLGSLRTQIEQQRKTILEMETASSEQAVALQRKDFEISTRDAKVKSLQDKVQHYKDDCEELKRRIAELEEEGALGGGLGGGGGGADGGGGGLHRGGLHEMSSAATLEKLAQLERENAALKAASAGDTNARVEQLVADLERMTSLRQRFEQQFLEANQRGLEAEALKERVKDLEERNAELDLKAREGSIVLSRLTNQEQASGSLEKRLAEAQRSLGEREAELAKAKEALARSEVLLNKTQTELVAKKQELSLVGLDQREVMETTRAALEAEFAARLEQEAGAAKARAAELEAQAEANAAKLAAASALAAEVEQLKASNAKQLADLNSLLQQKDASVQMSLDLQKDIGDLRAKLASAEARNDFEARENKRLEELLRTASSSSGAADEEKTQLRAAVQATERMVHEQRMLVLEKEKDLTQAQGQIKALELTVAQNDEALAKSKKDQERTQEYLKTAQTRISEVEEEREVLKTKLAAQVAAAQTASAVAAAAPADSMAISSLKQQLAEKEDELKRVKDSHNAILARREKESNLMITAFYELGYELQMAKQKMRGLPTSATANISFLNTARSQINGQN